MPILLFIGTTILFASPAVGVCALIYYWGEMWGNSP